MYVSSTRRTLTCCLLHHCCRSLPSLCLFILAFAPCEFKWKVWRDGKYLYVRTCTYPIEEGSSKSGSLRLQGTYQRATAATPVIREPRLLWAAMGWRAKKWHDTISFFSQTQLLGFHEQGLQDQLEICLSSVQFVSFLTQKFGLPSSQIRWDFMFLLIKPGSSCDAGGLLSLLNFFTWHGLCSALGSAKREPSPAPNIVWFPSAFPYIVSSFDCLLVRLILSFWYQFSSADLHFSFFEEENIPRFFGTIFRILKHIENLGGNFIDCGKQSVRQGTFKPCRCFAMFW